MRYGYVIAAALALSACMPSESPSSAESEQLGLIIPTLVVAPGPVNVATLPSALSALTAEQILCDSYQPAPAVVGQGDDEGDDEGDNEGSDDNASGDHHGTGTSLRIVRRRR